MRHLVDLYTDRLTILTQACHRHTVLDLYLLSNIEVSLEAYRQIIRYIDAANRYHRNVLQITLLVDSNICGAAPKVDQYDTVCTFIAKKSILS